MLLLLLLLLLLLRPGCVLATFVDTRVLRTIRRAGCENTRVLRALIAFNWRVDCENARVLRALIALSRRVDCENTRV